jgi:dipeptidase E
MKPTTPNCPEYSMLNRHLLLLSNTKNPNQDYLQHAAHLIVETLGRHTTKVLFIPYAQVLSSFSDFATLMRRTFRQMGYQLLSIPEVDDPIAAINDAEAIFVGGGNTFHLLSAIRANGLEGPIRARVSEGVPYIGSSAGANIACPTIMTTNDMPIVDPNGLTALNLIPFQINPHFIDADPFSQGGESRTERIKEFIKLHAGTYVVGLREGSMLKIDGSSIALFGQPGARIFVEGNSPKDYLPGDSVTFLLNELSSAEAINSCKNAGQAERVL